MTHASMKAAQLVQICYRSVFRHLGALRKPQRRSAASTTRSSDSAGLQCSVGYALQRRATRLSRARSHTYRKEGTRPVQNHKNASKNARSKKPTSQERGGQLQRPSCSVTQSVEENSSGILMWPRATPAVCFATGVHTQVPCFGGRSRCCASRDAAACPRGRCA